jgi:protein involved in polysaccharide export with SLBB domain
MSVMSCCSYLRPAAALGFLLLLSACGAGTFDPFGWTSTDAASSTPAGTSASAPTAKSAPTSGVQLRLSAGDKIKVIVFGEDKLSGEYQLDTAGAVSLPLAGTVEAAGLTKPELEQALTAKLKSEYLRNPKVTVDVISFRPFYVLGEVSRPGEYPYRSGLNVLSAIAIAGGATYRANNSIVWIQRAGTNEFAEYPQSPNIPVMPGDVLRLRERYF